MAGELGQQTVELGAMVRGAAEESYLALRELVEKSRAEAEARGKEGQQRSDTEKKIDLLKFVDRTRQRMLRLHVLAKWCQQVPLVHYCQQLASTLSSHETCFTQTADSLFFMHEGLQQARAPIFDVPFATEVLRTGSYRRLPKCIEEIGTQNTLFLDERRPTLKKLNTLVRAKLLETSLPKEISEVSVTDGIANLRVDGEFKVLLTLGYRGHFSLWRVLHMELLVGEKTGPIKLEETRRYALGDDIERRMANTDNPFMILYTVLHELCISLVMDTVIRQANVLRQGRWKDAIKSELISDSSATQSGNNAPVQLGQDGELDSSGFRIPGLKVNYWLDEKSSGSAEPDLSPFISIEAGKDMLIKCLHSSFILDPLTNKEADLSIDLSCIDVEALILKAIACNRHTCLLEIQRELRKNVQISQSPTDVVLKREEVHLGKKVDGRNFENSCTNEVLQVRAYGQSYIHLGINIRSGRLLFQSSKNILPPSALLESEEALNKGSLTASEVFVSLKTRSILHLFAATGRFLGLKVYSQSQVTLKIPKSVLYGSDFVVMGFPQCANAYYLLIQLDNDLRPVFHLLETWIDGSNKSNADAATDANEAIRFNRIDINSMQIGENEYSVNLFDAEKVLQDMVNYNQSIEGRLRQSGNSELVPLIPSFSPSFSSVVDEVFGSDPSSSTVENQLLPPYSSPSTHLSSIQVDLEGVTGTAGLPELGRNFMYSDINTSEVTPSVTLNSNLLSNLNYAKGTNAFSSSVPAGISFMSSDCKSGQDLSSLRSPEGHGIVHGSKSLQLLSSDGQRVLGNISTAKPGGPSRKRSVSEFLLNIPSLQQSRISDGPTKRRKVPERMKDGVVFMAYSSSAQSGKPLTYGNVLTEENHCVTSATYASVLRHVIKHCSLCIKYAQLTTQMNSLGIPYAEEVGLWTSSSSNLWLRLPFPKEDSWKHVCLHLGNAARMSWDVRINDPYYSSLWKVHGGSTTTEWGVGVRIANTSEIDSHITFDDDGVILTYHTVEADSIQKLVSDLQRLSNARAFSCGMRRSIGIKVDDKLEEKVTSSETKLHPARKGSRHRLSEQMRRIFRIEAVGLMSLWFSHGAVPMVHFVVEWEAGNSGCTIHVSPDQLWPHTKFLEDFVNVGEVASFLDCIRLTAGPLLALSSAIRPAKMPVTVPTGYSSAPKQNNIPSQGAPANDSSSTTMQNVSVPLGPAITHVNNHNLQSSVLSATGRGGPGLVPSSSFPFDVSVVLRGPYWIRIIYRKIFSVDIRCFAGDQVWLQPATPPKGGPSVGGSLPCPQFRPFIMEHVAQGLNAFEPGFMSARHSGAQLKANANTASGSQQSAPAPNRFNGAHGVAISGPIPNVGKRVVPSFTRAGSAMVASSKFASGIAGAPAHFSPGTNLPVHMKGELNSAFTGLGDDGGYGGSWVPLAALKKVLRGILKYFGVLWLFSQFPELLKEILGSVLKENEGALLNLDQEQPALRFFVGGYVFAVSVQRLQLLLQVLNVKRFHHQQQQQQAQSPSQEELATSDINEICDYFSRRVACEPYDASRVASFITLLTLPISVIREFIKLFAWNKSQFEAHGEIASAQRAQVELCLEKHQGSVPNDYAESSSSSKSNINHDRANHSVDFGLTFVLDHALIHRMSVSGGASWLPYCVSVRLRYTFGDNGHITFLAMEGSHGGKACWLQYEDWERCKQTVARAVETVNGSPAIGDTGQGRLRMVAEMVHKQLQLSLQQLRDGPLSASSNIP
ncbi:mediator of RNA polymerase II transcription subunit 14-like [Phragmites australis]|uniref:mediator of RNA polymerase II transcription subunit 14-like n=1 Tax=Phragmites australis TaxID=29695 RepID=UPI002D7782C7|nr:mediator of RNA polymerase II transcription subunit 14-like [Phragmites australis]